MKNRPTHRRILTGIFLAGIWISIAPAEILFIDSRTGSDENPGTRTQPLQTIAAAAEQVNRSTAPGPTQIILEPGIYNLGRAVLFKNSRSYTEQDRLTITASILPDDPNWLPILMPMILSTEDPRDPEKPDQVTDTYGLKIKISHVTLQGLKFLGSPVPNNLYAPIERIDRGLKDLLVTQCLFIGDEDALPIYCPAIATGDQFVVDHCIFHNCHASAVFWDGPEGMGGKKNAMRYCIVNGGLMSGVWICQTDKDFDYHHNIVINTEYFWLRKKIPNPICYRVENCILNTKYDSGYGVESGPTGQCGPEVAYEEKNVIRKAAVKLERNKQSRNYLHPTPGSAGCELGAGLFKPKTSMPGLSGTIAVTELLSVRQIHRGVYLVTHRFPFGANSLVVEMKDSSLVLVDTPYTPEATKELVDWFEAKLGKRKIIAINTGFHWDNLGGNDWLIKQGITVYGSDLTAKLVKERAVHAHAQTLRQLDTPEYKPYAQALRNLLFVPPTHLFPLNDGLELDFAGEKLRVYYPGPSHTQDNVVVYFPERRVLFGGCMISGWGGIGNTADADMDAWPKSIRKLRAFDFDLLVPGHGDRLDPNLIEETAALLEKANTELSIKETGS